MDYSESNIFEKSEMGQKSWSLPQSNPAWEEFEPDPFYKRTSSLNLPEISEINLTRHFSLLARKNMCIDTHFYPLGSCTMKLNPRVNEWAASLSIFSQTHPHAPDFMVQGNLELIFDLLELLSELSGFEGGTLLPNSGAQGEFCGIRMIEAYHQAKNEERLEILIPDNAHGTNPATAQLAGYKIITIQSNREGDIDLEDLKKNLSSKTAALMLTNPNTLGLFSPNILEIAELLHQAGGLLYYDGANFNPIMGVAEPGAMGFDVMHINLHKTFSTPHGGGGPGSGPVLCSKRLLPYLPLPRVEKWKEGFRRIYQDERSIGSLSTFNGNFAIYLRAYLYFKLHGRFGLRKISEVATLNANYLKHKIRKFLTIPYPQHCMHEFVVQADNYLFNQVKALDIAKRLLDYGFHAPTTYFPLIVKECLLIEPTESESKATLDHFVSALEAICKEASESPQLVKGAPFTQSVRRIDEVSANRHLIISETFPPF